MSLKWFHIVFVTITTLASLLLSAWSGSVYNSTGEQVYLIGAAAGVIFALVCVVYGFAFYKKIEKVNID
ncbi:MAG: hypothetical protein AAGA18_07580 [Verrucomicrobiota bacterium]